MHTGRPSEHRHVGAVVHDERGTGLAAAGRHWQRQIHEWPQREVLGPELDQSDARREPGIQQAGWRNLPRGGGIDIENGVKPRKRVPTRRDCPAFGQADSASEPFFSLGSGI